MVLDTDPMEVVDQANVKGMLLQLKADCVITLKGSSAVIEGSGAEAADRIVTITDGGTYVVTGTGNNVQLRVFTPQGCVPTLILCGAEIHCGFGPVLWTTAGELQIVALADNLLADTAQRTDDEFSPSKALVYGTDSLTITGEGALRLVANAGHGIHCKDYLKVDGPSMTIHSANDGIHANDGISMLSGTLVIIAQGDGMQTANAQSGKGNIRLTGGHVQIAAEKDALQAAGWIRVQGTFLDLLSGEGSTRGK